jgi:RNA polymerase-binding transcription factor
MSSPRADGDAAVMSQKLHESQRATREKLLLRASELRDRLSRVQADLGRRTEPLSRDAPDAAIVLENDEVLAAIETAANSELAHIEAAFERMNEGVFGICDACAQPIAAARLEAVPYATRCGSCARAA